VFLCPAFTPSLALPIMCPDFKAVGLRKPFSANLSGDQNRRLSRTRAKVGITWGKWQESLLKLVVSLIDPSYDLNLRYFSSRDSGATWPIRVCAKAGLEAEIGSAEESRICSRPPQKHG
jgi:hypothetical protein